MPKLHVRYSSMNAGKSTQLLQVAHNYEEGGHSIRVFTAAIDDRAGKGVIASRLGISRQAETFNRDTDFTEIMSADPGLACILIDECQFLEVEHVWQLHKMVHRTGITVMCWGIRSDSLGNPFPAMMQLLGLAEDISEVKAMCACGSKSTMQIRLDDKGDRVRSGDSILIGGNSRYKQCCAKCFYFN
jgi:thymidine kinase